MTRDRILLAASGGFVLALTFARCAPPAYAHDAPSGWTYPLACCSGFDCRPVPADWIEERREGFRIVVTGEVIPMDDGRVRHSPDGEFHWCSVAGSDDGRTICLFVPPRGF